MEQALLGTRVSFAESTVERVGTHLDDYAEAWVAQHTDACQATAVRGEQSDAVLDLRMACLQHAKIRLVAVTDVLAQADADVVSRAVGLVRSLPSLDHCGDVASLQSQTPPPSDADTAEAVETQRAALARARALVGVGKYAEAAKLAGEVEVEAEALEYPPFLAESKSVHGAALTKGGQYDEAYARLDEGLELALAHRMDAVGVELASDLALLTADRLGRPEEGHAWSTVALGLAEAHEPGGALEATALGAEAMVLRAEGKYREAVALYERILELEERVHGSEDPRLATALTNYAGCLRYLGRYEEAEKAARRAQAIVEVVHGPEHPTVASTMNTVAGAVLEGGDREGAEKILRASIELRRRALGPEHPLLAASLDNHAGVLAALGRLEEAEERAMQAFAIAERTLGPDNPEMALFHANIGTIQAELGRTDPAIGHLRKAIEIQGGAYGREHPSLVLPVVNLGTLLQKAGRSDGLEEFERAWAIASSEDVAPATAATCAVQLATALWSKSDEQPRAVKVVEAAKARLEAAGSDVQPELLAGIDAWLTEHPLPNP